MSSSRLIITAILGEIKASMYSGRLSFFIEKFQVLTVSLLFKIFFGDES